MLNKDEKSLYEMAKSIDSRTVLNLIRNSRSREERDFYVHIADMNLQRLQQNLCDRKKNNGLVLLPLWDQTNYACILTEMDNTDVRDWVYKMGRKLGSELSGLLTVLSEELLFQMEQVEDLTIVDAETFERKVDEWIRWSGEGQNVRGD